MKDLSDQQLLRDYTKRRSEAAFTELVRRHIDLIHSAAIRMTGEAHSAQDVMQTVFLTLAQNADRLKEHPVLSGWLHTTARNLAAKHVRAVVRRQNYEQEAAAMNELPSSAPDTSWEEIARYLDAALGELSELDRDAILLRYFEKKSASQMAGILGISDEAAQKRVSRSVERLREIFVKRGVTVGTSGLAVVISANAVQAAPVGLAVTISTAAATLTGTTLATTTTATATKAVAMTAIQKTLVTATVVVLAGAGVYEANQASQLRDQVQVLQQEQAPLTTHVNQLQRERDEATNSLALLAAENERLNGYKAELLKLRGEASRLRQELADLRSETAAAKSAAGPAASFPPTNKFPDVVYVGGEVGVPGPKLLSQGMKLTDSIKVAGNLTDWASPMVVVTDTRGFRKDFDLREITSGKEEDPLLRPEDRVNVRRSESAPVSADPGTPQK